MESPKCKIGDNVKLVIISKYKNDSAKGYVQVIIQKKSTSSNQMLSLFDKQVSFFPKIVLFYSISEENYAKSAFFLKITNAAVKF